MKPSLRVKTILQEILQSKYLAPAVLFIVPVIAFGLLLPSLGFYWDDWPVVYLGKVHGNFWQYYQSDRPLMAWPDLAFLFFAGENPLRWQIMALLTKIATIFSFWWCLNLLWPKARNQALTAALLFSIYPVFLSQSMAITYKSHFICLCLFLVSTALMLLALRKPRYFVLFMVLALLTDALQLATLEYFWGLELLRPVLLWLVIAEGKGSRQQLLKKTFLNWLPYLLIFGGVILWRFFFLHLADDRNAPTVLLSLFHTPLSSAINLFLVVLRDSMHILIGNWLEVFQVQTLDVASLIDLLSWGVALFVIVGLGVYLFVVFRKEDENQPEMSSWSRQALGVGSIALLVGMIPVWLTNRQVSIGTYSDRLAIPALVGASIFISGLLHGWISKWSQRAVILSILVGLSVGLHVRTANDYRWEWTYQERFYWQLFWRAPALKPGTALLSEGGIFQWVTKYSLATAINTLFPVPNGTTALPYWTFELDNLPPQDELLRGIDLKADLRTLTFQASSRNSLVISYDPYHKVSTSGHCLWVLSSEDALDPAIGPLTEDTLPLSNLDRILALPTGSDYPDLSTFGPEPPHTWCFYFEKADLARQFGDWETVRLLGDQAISLSFAPSEPYEWIPFIEGYLHGREWEKAGDLTLEAGSWDFRIQPAFCEAWSRSIEGMTLSPEELAIVQQIQEELNCSNP